MGDHDNKEFRSPREIELDELLKAAELEKTNAELREAKASATIAEANAAAVTIDVAIKTELRADALAGDIKNRVYQFLGPVFEKSVYECIATLTKWARREPGAPIEVVFNSPGGSVVDGMALFDYLQTLRRSGIHITTTTYGMAASMAGILLQAGDTRRMGAEAWVLIHQGSFGAGGTVGEVEDRVEWVKKIQERILDIFAARSNMSRANIKKNWSRKDWWLSSADCIKHGFVDELV